MSVLIGLGLKKNSEVAPVVSLPQYIVNLTQTGTNNPVATVLKNNIGFSIVWSRVSQNVFYGVANFKFPPNRTALFINKPLADSKIERLNSSTLKITTLDDSLEETTISVSIIEENGLFSEEFNQNFN